LLLVIRSLVHHGRESLKVSLKFGDPDMPYARGKRMYNTSENICPVMYSCERVMGYSGKL